MKRIYTLKYYLLVMKKHVSAWRKTHCARAPLWGILEEWSCARRGLRAGRPFLPQTATGATHMDSTQRKIDATQAREAKEAARWIDRLSRLLDAIPASLEKHPAVEDIEAAFEDLADFEA